MKKILTAMFLLASILMVSCGGDDSSDNKDNGVNCTGVDKFCNSNDGTLWWSDVSSESMNWTMANNYCEILGGRLPTISELRTLVKSCTGTVTGGSCDVTDDCLCYSMSCGCLDENCICENRYIEGNLVFEYSVFGDTFTLWSVSETSDMDQDYVWYIDFFRASINSNIKTSPLSFRCVK
ncbi:MAG TPA: hypothetical protein PLT70_06520 [bacterium]|nr:hypothetical protein [bacterium]HQN74000.1 hypothetical protein [bacterium]